MEKRYKRKIVPRTKYDNLLNIQAYEFARVGCGLMGLWFLAGNLPPLVPILILNLREADMNTSSFQSMDMYTQISLVETVVYLIIGSILLFKAGKIAKFISGINPVTQNKESAADIATSDIKITD